MDLSGKKLVVTGGSSGIGRDIVLQARNAGASVLFTYNSGENASKEISEKTGAENRHFVLGNQGSTSSFFEFLGNRDKIDYFIANAGVELSGDLSKHTFDEITRVVNANLIGNLYLLQGLITQDRMNNGGQIAVIGSIAADGNHDQLAYSASKAGLRGGVESLSRYDAKVMERGLGIKLLEPAFVRTPMTERVLKLLERRVIPRKGGEALVQQFKEQGLVMDSAYAAGEILRLTADSGVIGVRTIPEGVDLHKIRETYF